MKKLKRLTLKSLRRKNYRKKNKKTKRVRRGGGKLDMFQSMIMGGFKHIAEEKGWTDYKEAATAYLKYLQTFEPGTTVGGGVDFYKYLNYALVLVVGRFDTPCNVILSNISFVLYCIVATTFTKAYQKHGTVAGALADEEYAHSLADPVQYVLYYNFRALYNIQEQAFTIFRQCAQKLFKTIQIPAGSTAEYVTMAIRSTLYSPQLYKLLIVKPISCILKSSIKSCEEYCADE